MSVNCKVLRPFGNIGKDMIGKIVPVIDSNRARLLVLAGYVERVEETAVSSAVVEDASLPETEPKQAVVAPKRRRKRKTTSRKQTTRKGV